jgi:signal transduction histidine kinase
MKRKIFLSFFVIFTLFALGVLFIERSREQEFKTRSLEEKLDVYADIAHAAFAARGADCMETTRLFPANVRLTLIDAAGTVLHDNVVAESATMENHLSRPEIAAAKAKGFGSNVRVSSTNERKYLYRAKRFDDTFVRVALPYDINLQNVLKTDNLFLVHIVVLFVVMLVIIDFAAGRFGKSIRRLRDFTENLERGRQLSLNFPDDELGEIGTKIAANFRRLDESRREIALEREKLLRHVHSSGEGLCFFSSDRSVEFHNALFMQYLNTIADETFDSPHAAFTDPALAEIAEFVRDGRKSGLRLETRIDRQGKTFAVRTNVFDDDSFEIIINDITKQEKTRRLKREMTENITHELRTPVTGIRGCLETVLSHCLEPEKRDHFIRNAYSQVLALSELIRDMSLITKIENAPQSFKTESVDMGELLESVKNDMEVQLRERNITFEWNLDNVFVTGNRNLLYSVFGNLTDNVIRYAGANVCISVKKYGEDGKFYYFSYSDNGTGVPDEHLNRLFERFYRISEGRTRDTGGSGLGLSIVKNAVAFHQGSVTAKNKTGGGLEFLFGLPR